MNFGEEYNGFVWGLGMMGFGRVSRETGVNSGGFFFFNFYGRIAVINYML